MISSFTSKYLKFTFLLLSFSVLLSCTEKENPPAKSSAKQIKSFVFKSQTVTATIDSVQRTITAIFPIGTDVSKLSPTITISDKASITPTSESIQDFTKPVIYTVTAEDGTVQSFTVTTTVLKSSAKQIKSFVLNGLTPAVVATIDTVNNIISLKIPFDSEITKLTPTIVISDRASINPTSGMVQDLSKNLTYIVTAEDGTSKVYQVKVEKISGIIEQNAQGKVKGSDFIIKKSFSRIGTVTFGGQSYQQYEIGLHDTDISECSYNKFPTCLIIAPPNLEVGLYSKSIQVLFWQGNATTTYTNGILEVIKISNNLIEGKIKGGRIEDGNYIEGKFISSICK